jgi:hypothetical protein
MSKIGFSTKCLSLLACNIRDAAIFFFEGKAEAIELHFSAPADFNAFELDDRTVEAIKKFSFISLHAPSREIRYGANPETEKIIVGLKKICAALPIKGIIIHPDIIDDFAPLVDSGLPFLLENMYKKEAFGSSPEDFIVLKNKCNFGFVLDLQHVYENDPLMEKAREFVMIMGERLCYFHVSGQSDGQGHAPVYLSRNCEAIAEILKMKINVPKILEGVFGENPLGTMTTELAFVKKFE